MTAVISHGATTARALALQDGVTAFSVAQTQTRRFMAAIESMRTVVISDSLQL